MARDEVQLTPEEQLIVWQLEWLDNNTVIYKDNAWVYQDVALWVAWTVLQSNWATSAPSFAAVWTWDMVLASVQSVTGLKTFDKDKLAMKWTSTWTTTVSTANTGATNYTQTMQARNWTIANLDNETYIGTTAVALNRTSAALTLAGITFNLTNNTLTWTKAQFDTAVSDWNICFDWDSVTNLNMNTWKLLWRNTASAGAVEEITLWTNLSFSWTTLNATWWWSTDISCRVYITSIWNMPYTLTAVPFDTEDFDTDTMHDNVTNNTRITFNTAWKYLVTWNYIAAYTQNTRCVIRLNWTTDIFQNASANSSIASSNNWTVVSFIYNFAQNDYIEMLWMSANQWRPFLTWNWWTHLSVNKIF